MHSRRGDGKSSIFPGGLKEQPRAQGWGSPSPAGDVNSPQRGVPHLSPSHKQGHSMHPPRTCAPPAHPCFPTMPTPACSPPNPPHTHTPCPTLPTPACTGTRPCTNVGCTVTQLTRPAAACFAPANYRPPPPPPQLLAPGSRQPVLTHGTGSGRRGGLPHARQLPSRAGWACKPPLCPGERGGLCHLLQGRVKPSGEGGSHAPMLPTSGVHRHPAASRHPPCPFWVTGLPAQPCP